MRPFCGESTVPPLHFPSLKNAARAAGVANVDPCRIQTCRSSFSKAFFQALAQPPKKNIIGTYIPVEGRFKSCLFMFRLMSLVSQKNWKSWTINPKLRAALAAFFSNLGICMQKIRYKRSKMELPCSLPQRNTPGTEKRRNSFGWNQGRDESKEKWRSWLFWEIMPWYIRTTK